MRRLVSTLLVVSLTLLLGRWGVAEDATRVLIVVGPSQHPPGTHEVSAGGRLLEHCLAHVEGEPVIRVDVVDRWPEAPLRESADTVVFLGDTFPANRFDNSKQNLADLDAMMRRGCGIVCVHFTTGLLGQDVGPDGGHPLLEWLGGYFANRSCPHHQSIARVFDRATITPAATEHPVNRGWREFTIRDEPYIKNYFGPDGPRPNVTILATSQLPPEDPRREAVAWCVERKDGGRGFAVVMPHFYKNWGQDDLRRMVLNGILWTSGRDVPAGGVTTTEPDLTAFSPTAVEPSRPAKTP